MWLTNKSLYSATINCAFHLFVHTIGCANARIRSINSRLVGEANVNDVLANARMLNYVRGSRNTLQPQFYSGPNSGLETVRAELGEAGAGGAIEIDGDLVSEASIDLMPVEELCASKKRKDKVPL